MKKILALTILTAILFSAIPASAVELDSLLKGIRERYGSVTDMKADFKQETMVQTLGRKQVKSGTVMFKQPDKMRWDYVKPSKQQLLTDGYTLWVYQPDDKVVYMRKLDAVQSAKVPMQILSGKIDPGKEFDVKILKEEAGAVHVRLKPRGGATGYEKAILYVNAEDFKINKIDIVDLYGNVTELTLSNMTFNNKLKEGDFVYAPIEGVKVESAPVME